jgi:hypothetical protein
MKEADKVIPAADLPATGPFPAWIPGWAHGILTGLLLGAAVAGMTLLVGLDMENRFGPASTATTRWFALFAALGGFYAGNCLVGPKPVRSVLILVALVSGIVIVGWSLVVEEKLVTGRHGARTVLLEGTPAVVVGVLFILAGAGVAWRQLFQKPLTIASIVAAILAFPIVAVGLFCAVWHLLAKYGGMG